MRGGGYETQADREQEEAFASIACDRWRCVMHKLPASYRVDFMVMRDDRLVGWVEFKERNRWYPRMMLGLSKFLAGQGLARITAAPFLMVYGVNGEYRYVDLTHFNANADLKVVWGGRSDRNDGEDNEPVVLIPLDLMTSLVR